MEWINWRFRAEWTDWTDWINWRFYSQTPFLPIGKIDCSQRNESIGVLGLNEQIERIESTGGFYAKTPFLPIGTIGRNGWIYAIGPTVRIETFRVQEYSVWPFEWTVANDETGMHQLCIPLDSNVLSHSDCKQWINHHRDDAIFKSGQNRPMDPISYSLFFIHKTDSSIHYFFFSFLTDLTSY